MVNSDATARDVIRVAKHLGHEIAQPSKVTLDADYRAATANLLRVRPKPTTIRYFSRTTWRRAVLSCFVSTIESRKNHLSAFSCWLNLIKKYGPERVPKLVCVGNKGWLNDTVYAKLQSSRLLQSHVVMLSKISDFDLQKLYLNCLFTIYPSSYEGWGLPVTESLCFGKVPVISNSSSLPEAGGKFAVYFDLGSENMMLAALERMIYDDAFRRKQEEEIRTKFKPRTWGGIAEQMLALVASWASRETPPRFSSAVTQRGTLAGRRRPGNLPQHHRQQQHVHSFGNEIGRTVQAGRRLVAAGELGLLDKDEGRAPSLSGRSIGSSLDHLRRRSRRTIAKGLGSRGPGRRREPDIRVSTRPGYVGYFQPFRGGCDVIAQKRRPVARRTAVLIIGCCRFFRGASGVDVSQSSIGVRGFMVCQEDDLKARLKFIEMTTFGVSAQIQDYTDFIA